MVENMAMFDNINMLVLAGIIAAVLLAFVLVVMIFAVRLRSWQENYIYLFMLF